MQHNPRVERKLRKMSVILRHLHSTGLKNILVYIAVIWCIFLLIFVLIPMPNTNTSPTDHKTAQRLTKALAELEILQKQNQELQEIFKDMMMGSVCK